MMRSSLVVALTILALSACDDGNASVVGREPGGHDSSTPTAPLAVPDVSSPVESISRGARALPGVTYVLEVGTHCGVEWLGLPVNDVFWITDEADESASDWIPIEWSQTLSPGEQLIALEVVLSADGSHLTATKAGRSVVYRPNEATDPEKFCA